jgi:hypothetical protein
MGSWEQGSYGGTDMTETEQLSDVADLDARLNGGTQAEAGELP